jgi:replication factor C large subunit
LTAKQAINNVDKDPDEIFWWIENNITNEYEDPKEIAQAFDVLSRADLFRSQVSSTQDWRLKGYMIDMMTAGIAVSKKEMYRKFTRYQYPQNIIFLGSSKQDRKEMKELLGKLSKQFHCSSKKLKMHYLPFFRIMLKDKKLNKNFMSSFNLNEDEMEVLK